MFSVHQVQNQLESNQTLSWINLVSECSADYGETCVRFTDPVPSLCLGSIKAVSYSCNVGAAERYQPRGLSFLGLSAGLPSYTRIRDVQLIQEGPILNVDV